MGELTVLTGDFVGSSDVSPFLLDEGFAALRSVFDSYAEFGHADFTRYRGDGWQSALTAPRLGLRAALAARAALKARDAGLDSRIAVATVRRGAYETGALDRAGDPVFVMSGRCLDAMPTALAFDFGVQPSPNPDERARDQARRTSLRLADLCSRGWTGAQAEAMLQALHPRPSTQVEIADRLGVTRQAVNQSLAAAGWRQIALALEAWEGRDDDTDRTDGGASG